MTADTLAICIRRFLQDHITLQKGCSRGRAPKKLYHSE